MEASIDYLTRVHGDLLDAATRERRGALGPRRRRGPSSGLIAAAVAILALAGLVGAIAKNGGIFTGASDDAGSAAVPAAPTARDPFAGATGSTGGNQFGYDGAVPGPAPAPGTPQGSEKPVDRIIRTAEMTVVIPRDTFERRLGDAVAVAEDNGGFVADTSSRDRSGSLTIRVPSDSFEQTLKALRDLGDIDVQSIHGKDVTAEYVDFRSRLRIATARRDVLLGLMAQANSIAQTIHVQNALDETQLRIEELQGQLRLLNDRTSLATIELDMREEGVVHESEPPSIPNAFERAIDGFLATVGAIVVGLGYLLPVVAIALAWWFITTRLRRRREIR
jgi:hypothetical protein